MEETEAWLFWVEAQPPMSRTGCHAASWEAQPVGLSFTDHSAPTTRIYSPLGRAEGRAATPGKLLAPNFIPLIKLDLEPLNAFLAPKEREDLRVACPAHLTISLWVSHSVKPQKPHWLGDPTLLTTTDWTNVDTWPKLGHSDLPSFEGRWKSLAHFKPHCPSCSWVSWAILPHNNFSVCLSFSEMGLYSLQQK